MQLGNGLWETEEYNERLQVKQIGLGMTDSTQGLLKLEYAYNTTGNDDDNGALLEQKITVPAVGTNLTFHAHWAALLVKGSAFFLDFAKSVHPKPPVIHQFLS